jgi:hypothetical protein
VGAPGDSAVAGTLTLPLAAPPPAQVQPPVAADLPLSGSVRLVGYGLEGEAQPGAPLTFDLYFAGDATNGNLPLTLALAGPGDGTAPPAALWTGTLAPDAVWAAGDILCRRLHVRLPGELVLGDYRWEIATGDVAVPVAALAVAPSTRLFALPDSPKAVAVDATVSDSIALVAYETVMAGEPLAVTLAWQALVAPAFDATAFVHLLDSAGNLVAQSDAVPGDYHTNRWIAGEYVLDTHWLALPEDLAPGSYELRAGLYDPVTGQRLPAVDVDGAPYPDSAIPLGRINLPLDAAD